MKLIPTVGKTVKFLYIDNYFLPATSSALNISAVEARKGKKQTVFRIYNIVEKNHVKKMFYVLFYCTQ